jgi:hypothetical protein
MMGKSYYVTMEQRLNQEQEILLCAGSIRNMLPCVRPPSFTRACLHSADNATCFIEIKAIEEGLFDEKRYSLETPLTRG